MSVITFYIQNALSSWHTSHEWLVGKVLHNFNNEISAARQFRSAAVHLSTWELFLV